MPDSTNNPDTEQQPVLYWDGASLHLQAPADFNDEMRDELRQSMTEWWANYSAKLMARLALGRAAPDAPPCPAWCTRHDKPSPRWDFVDGMDGVDKDCEAHLVAFGVLEQNTVELTLRQSFGRNHSNGTWGRVKTDGPTVGLWSDDQPIALTAAQVKKLIDGLIRAYTMITAAQA